MIKTKRVLAVVALAAGASALAAPAASADSSGRYLLSVPDELDKLGASSVPADRRAELPSVTDQLKGVQGLHKLNELQQFTGMVTPVLGVVPAIQ